MMLVCRSFVDRLCLLTHPLGIEIGNLAYSFFGVLGLDLVFTKFVLANVHVGVASPPVRRWAQNPLTIGKGHCQQILGAVSPLHEDLCTSICLHSRKDHRATFKPPGMLVAWMRPHLSQRAVGTLIESCAQLRRSLFGQSYLRSSFDSASVVAMGKSRDR